MRLLLLIAFLFLLFGMNHWVDVEERRPAVPAYMQPMRVPRAYFDGRQAPAGAMIERPFPWKQDR